MEREILSIEIIRREIKSSMRRGFIGAVICLAIFLVSLLGSVVYITVSGYFFRGLISFGFPLGFLYFTVFLFSAVYKTRFFI